MNRQTNKFHRDIQHLNKEGNKMQKTLEQLDKDIELKHEMRGRLIDESVKIRQRLQDITAVLEYQSTEIRLLEEERQKVINQTEENKNPFRSAQSVADMLNINGRNKP
tara:strand:+ start:996 stop:1319 length:324 start_codon:yes stop_codon:yes gene_type:complete